MIYIIVQVARDPFLSDREHFLGASFFVCVKKHLQSASECFLGALVSRKYVTESNLWVPSGSMILTREPLFFYK